MDCSKCYVYMSIFIVGYIILCRIFSVICVNIKMNFQWNEPSKVMKLRNSKNSISHVCFRLKPIVSFIFWHLYPRGMSPDTQFLRDWVGLTSGVDVSEETEYFLILLRIKIWFLGRPACRVVTKRTELSEVWRVFIEIIITRRKRIKIRGYKQKIACL
jgi:hypothetical protein